MERGERGSTEEHLTVTQFKVQQEQTRLQKLEQQAEKQEHTIQKLEEKTKVQKKIIATHNEIDQMGRKTLLGRIEFTPDEAKVLKDMAKTSLSANALIAKLKEQLAEARRTAQMWKERYEKLWDQTYDYVQALKRMPEQTKKYLQNLLHTQKENVQEKTSLER